MSMTGNTSKKEQLKIESGQTPPAEKERKPFRGILPAASSGFREWSEREYGLPGIVNTLGDIRSSALEGVGRFFTGVPETTPQTPLLPQGGALSAGLGMQEAGMDTGGTPFASAGGQYVPSPAEVLAAMTGGGGGGGMAAPDYSQYRQALTDQAQQVNAQIQAMYNALGEEAAANVGRIQDIYGGASTGIGDVYGSAIGNVGDAYSSAQQQAADQLARLGIEEAAPAVVNPMALSQAEAISQLEQGQAGGQAATERYGASAGGFGSQMAQVAQQQGTEMNAAILAALQNRLNESLLMEEQGRQAAASSGGGGGMSLQDQIAFDEFYRQTYGGELPLEEREFALRQAQALAEPELEQRKQNRELLLSLILPQDGQKPVYDRDTALQFIKALESEGY